MKKKAIDNAKIARELMHENAELKKWKAGAEALMANYYKLIVDKDDRSYKLQQDFNELKAELTKLKQQTQSNG